MSHKRCSCELQRKVINYQGRSERASLRRQPDKKETTVKVQALSDYKQNEDIGNVNQEFMVAKWM